MNINTIYTMDYVVALQDAAKPHYFHMIKKLKSCPCYVPPQMDVVLDAIAVFLNEDSSREQYELIEECIAASSIDAGTYPDFTKFLAGFCRRYGE